LDVIRWGEDKNDRLRRTRGVSLEQIAEQILAGEYLDIVKSPTRAAQEVFVLRIAGYTWAVPFVSDGDIIFLKTAFRSRKLHRRYGGLDAQDQTRPG
jgi:hypothetical protein